MSALNPEDFAAVRSELGTHLDADPPVSPPPRRQPTPAEVAAAMLEDQLQRPHVEMVSLTVIRPALERAIAALQQPNTAGGPELARLLLQTAAHPGSPKLAAIRAYRLLTGCALNEAMAAITAIEQENPRD